MVKPSKYVWPNPRADTLKAIRDELSRARKKHPRRDNNLTMLQTAVNSLVEELYDYTHNRTRAASAGQIYARSAQVAAMAIRVLEEGTAGHRYAGNVDAFKLEP